MENLDIQHNIEKQIKALTQKTNKIKFNKMLCPFQKTVIS